MWCGTPRCRRRRRSRSSSSWPTTFTGLDNPVNRKGPFTTSPADLRAAGVPKGRYLRVEFVLKSDDRQNQISPKLKSFDVNYECEIIIQ